MYVDHERTSIFDHATRVDPATVFAASRVSASAALRWVGCWRAMRSALRRPLAVKQSIIPARAKNIIYLHMSGAPPQHDLFDWKPKLDECNMQPCPDELLKGQTFAFIKGTPKLLGRPHKFAQHGEERRVGQRAAAAFRRDRG